MRTMKLELGAVVVASVAEVPLESTSPVPNVQPVGIVKLTVPDAGTIIRESGTVVPTVTVAAVSYSRMNVAALLAGLSSEI